MPAPLCARQGAGTVQGRWLTILQSFRAVSLLKSTALIFIYFFFFFSIFFLSGMGQRPDLIYGLVFIKVSECSGLTPLNVRSDAWLFSLLMSCITERLDIGERWSLTCEDNWQQVQAVAKQIIGFIKYLLAV